MKCRVRDKRRRINWKCECSYCTISEKMRFLGQAKPDMVVTDASRGNNFYKDERVEEKLKKQSGTYDQDREKNPKEVSQHLLYTQWVCLHETLTEH